MLSYGGGGKPDAIVADPPYGIGFVHSTGGGCLARSTKFGGIKIKGDDKPFDPMPFLDYPIVVLWGANHYASRLPDSSGWLIWDKRDGTCTNDQADCELAWTNQKFPARIKRHLWNGMLKDSEKGIERVHPTQKPIVVMSWCMEVTKILQDVLVCDPFMGSGTTGIACIRTGRKFVGIEIDKTYFDIARERIERELAQGILFGR